MKSPKYYFKSAELHIMSIFAPKLLTSPKAIYPKDNNGLIEMDIDFDLKYYYSYYFYRFHKDVNKIFAWDKDNYPFNYLESPKHYTNPLATAQYLLMLSVQEGFWEIEYMQFEFVRIANRLDELGKWEGEYFIWRISESVPKFKTPKDFCSGIIQACCLSVYLRWNQISPNTEIKFKIEAIFKSFQFPIDQGGFYTMTEENFPWLEEYPNKYPVQVLNGHLYAVVSAYEYAHQISKKFDFAEKLLEGFLFSYQKFRLGPFLKYCRYYPMLCNVTYQMLHDQQLIHLTYLTGRNRIIDLQNEWASTYNREFCFKQLGIKNLNINFDYLWKEGPISRNDTYRIY